MESGKTRGKCAALRLFCSSSLAHEAGISPSRSEETRSTLVESYERLTPHGLAAYPKQSCCWGTRTIAGEYKSSCHEAGSLNHARAWETRPTQSGE